MIPPLVDQAARDRFVKDHASNLSVIAPAGVGKTTAIVERIVALAQLPEDLAIDRLTRLVVVTYSVRAAQQMQHKARLQLRAAQVNARVQRAFQQAFFGTIHSFCVKLLDRFGHCLGLAASAALLQDEDELWRRFLVRGLPADLASGFEDLAPFYAPERLYRLGRELSPGAVIAPGPLPTLDLAPVLDFPVSSLKGSTKKAIEQAQVRLRAWAEAWARGERHRGLPKGTSSKQVDDFIARWDAVFAPLFAWARAAGLAYARGIAKAYEKFRIANAVMTYDDQVRWAVEVLKVPSVRAELAQERLCVLLDEAQDTDPRQFDVLRAVAGLGAPDGQPDAQTFCLVGDFQQAIYAPRSDLPRYQQVHDEVANGPRGQSSVFSVTFRCDRAVIDFVNRLFPPVLDGQGGQSLFRPLAPRHDAGPGQVLRWRAPSEVEPSPEGKTSQEARAEMEAEFLADQIAALQPAGLGARGWAQVAILCPRHAWLAQIETTLRARGLPTQLHTANDDASERLAERWLAALVWIAAHPEDAFEIAGVLREVLGVSDAAMARHTQRDGARLRLDRETGAENSEVATALALLREACAGVDSLPPAEAVRRLVAKTHLRERLRVVADDDCAGAELDEVLARVAACAAEGTTLAALAHVLRSALAQERAGEEEIRDAIQLMTSYKSKGLEWDVVLVPYVFRVIGARQASYPRVDTIPGGRDILSRDKADFDRDVAAVAARRDWQQYQRLLYVVSTRARRTLVWVDDEPLFAGQLRGSWSSSADYLFLTPSGANREAWEALPETPALPPPEREESGADEIALPELPTFTGDIITRARARADDLPRRVTPHALAVHPPPEAEPERDTERDDEPERAGGPGVRYGTWWHEFVETLPWDLPRHFWQKRFDEARRSAPDVARAEREWARFLDSALAAWLERPGRLVQVEVPFLWPREPRVCFEGVIDMAVFAPDEARWHVIDWKTNRVGPAGPAGVAEIYREQVRAYVAALRAVLAAEVRGSLYLTQTGEWLPVD
jgi:ATP-dependent exoDNAse (exonuclease V) beta subunit